MGRRGVKTHCTGRGLTARIAEMRTRLYGPVTVPTWTTSSRRTAVLDVQSLDELPWARRPRRHVRQILQYGEWRLPMLVLICAPLMVGKLAWPLWGGPRTSAGDWLMLALTLLPWAYLAAWLRRPSSNES